MGADDAFFDLPDLDAPAGRFTVLYAGGFLPLHGLTTIVEAAERLFARGHTDIQFELVGDGIEFRAVKERVLRRRASRT